MRKIFPLLLAAGLLLAACGSTPDSAGEDAALLYGSAD